MGWRSVTSGVNKPYTPGSTIFIAGAEYKIPWERLLLGTSFTIPTVVSAREVSKALGPAVHYYGYRIMCEEVLWYDCTAVRVHRIA